MALLTYLVIIVFTYIIYTLLTKDSDYFEKKGVKYLKAIPLLGSANSLFRQRTSFPEAVLKWYNTFPSEKIYGFFQMTSPMFIIRDPQLVKKLCVKDFDFFSDHRILLDESQDKLFGKALISLRGDKWKDMRSTLSPAFTGSKMREMFKLVAKVSKQGTMTLKEKIVSDAISNEVEFKELSSKFTVDNIATCAFGIEVNSFENPDNHFQSIAKEFTNFSNFKTVLKFAGYLVAPWLMKALGISFISKTSEKFFEEAIIDTINTREQKGIVRHDMINLLIQVKKGNLKHESKEEDNTLDGFATVEESEVGKALNKRVWEDIDLAAQCFIFFVAGFDTVSTTIGFMAYELMRNPEIQEKLHDEILECEEGLGDGELISYEKLQSLKYLDQVVSEVLRVWPAAPGTDRICTKDYDMDVDGLKFTFEAGKNFFVPVYGFHHDPQYFPNPEKFDPERFSDENRESIQEYTYMPFGVGPRNCIGSRFALMEVKTVFYYLILNFRLQAGPKAQIPIKLAQLPVGMKTEKGTWIELHPRISEVLDD